MARPLAIIVEKSLFVNTEEDITHSILKRMMMITTMIPHLLDVQGTMKGQDCMKPNLIDEDAIALIPLLLLSLISLLIYPLGFLVDILIDIASATAMTAKKNVIVTLILKKRYSSMLLLVRDQEPHRIDHLVEVVASIEMQAAVGAEIVVAQAAEMKVEAQVVPLVALKVETSLLLPLVVRAIISLGILAHVVILIIPQRSIMNKTCMRRLIPTTNRENIEELCHLVL
jgi:hypothetical protein